MFRTQIRVPDDLYAKARVLAAIHNVSFNQLILNLLDSAINDWENAHGVLPTLPEEDS